MAKPGLLDALADPAAAREALGATITDGGLVLFGSDGVYGLACDPLRPEAVVRLERLKRRPPGKPSAVMYLSPLAFRELLASIGARTGEALAALLPGRVTVVVANPDRRYPLACGDSPERLGVRLIAGPLAGVMTPILQSSANRSGEPAPRELSDVDPEISDAVDLVVDVGPLDGRASTVVDLSDLDTNGAWSVLREGAVPRAEIERQLGAAAKPPREPR